MKQWMCMDCGRRGESEDNVIIKLCAACVEEMEEVENGK